MIVGYPRSAATPTTLQKGTEDRESVQLEGLFFTALSHHLPIEG